MCKLVPFKIVAETMDTTWLDIMSATLKLASLIPGETTAEAHQAEPDAAPTVSSDAEMMRTVTVNVGASPPALYPLTQVAGPQVAPVASCEVEQVIAAEATDVRDHVIFPEVTDEGVQVIDPEVTVESELKVASEITDESETKRRRETPNEPGSPLVLFVVPTKAVGKRNGPSSSQLWDYLIHRVEAGAT